MLMLGLGLSPLRAQSHRWWPEGAVYAADFVSNRYMREGVEIPPEAAFSFSRGSSKMAPDRAGIWHSFAPDTPARTNKGLLLEGEETYYPTNSALTGLTPGIVGAGGALATGWGYSIGAGGTLTVEAATTVNGLPGFVVTWDIENVSGATIYPNIRFATPPAAQGETWTGAFWYDAVDNPGDSGIDSTLVLQERQGGAFLSTTAVTLLVAGSTRQMTTGTFSQPATNSVWFLLSHILAPGQALNRTMTVALPTLTRSGDLTSPAPTTDGIVTLRTADMLVLHLPQTMQDMHFVFADGTGGMTTNASGDYLVAPSGKSVAQVFCYQS